MWKASKKTASDSTVIQKNLDEMEKNTRIQLHEYIKIQNTKIQQVTTETIKRNKNEQHRTRE